MSAETSFLNVDLDIRTHAGLDRLLRYFEQHCDVLHHTEHEAVLENLRIVQHHTEHEAVLESLLPDGDIDDMIRAFLRILAGMDEDLQALWRGCEMRRMNIGIEAGGRPRAAVFLIGAEVMKGLVDAGCDVAITVYAAGPAATGSEPVACPSKP
jgi:hypothetical protein